MQRGDKLYSYWNGQLRVVTFLEESLAAPECGTPTYLCREPDGRRFRCSREMYCKTEAEALARYLDQCRESLAGTRRTLEAAKLAILEIKVEIAKTEARLKSLPAV